MAHQQSGTEELDAWTCKRLSEGKEELLQTPCREQRFTSNRLRGGFDPQKGREREMFKLYTDGACHPNPGSMSASYALYHNDELLSSMLDVPIGEGTSNLAEYLALILGLEVAKVWLSTELRLNVYVDSELLVKQLMGEYQVRNPRLRQVYGKVSEILEERAWRATWISRDEMNSRFKLAGRIEGRGKQR